MKSSLIPSMRWRWLNWPAAARRTAAVAFFVLTNWLFLAPSTIFEDIQILFPFQDKLVHFAIFSGLAGLTRWSTSIRWGRGWHRVVMGLVWVGYGAVVECIQPRLPGAGRGFEWGDLVFDGIGVAVGLWVCDRLTCETLTTMDPGRNTPSI